MPDINAGVLLRRKMREKFIKQRQTVAAGLQPLKAKTPPEIKEDGAVFLTETRVYVGLNDKESKKQEYETGKYLDLLKKICRDCHAAFSVDVEEGGYYHEDGEYTEETSLVLVLIDAERETVRKIAEALRAAFHQESVLVTENRISGYFIGEE